MNRLVRHEQLRLSRNIQVRDRRRVLSGPACPDGGGDWASRSPGLRDLVAWSLFAGLLLIALAAVVITTFPAVEQRPPSPRRQTPPTTARPRSSNCPLTSRRRRALCRYRR